MMPSSQLNLLARESCGLEQYHLCLPIMLKDSDLMFWLCFANSILLFYRWPGGNFVSGYNWRDGIGDVDKRPPRKNPAWQGVEANDVGIHEFMGLCELIKAEPYIAVNAGLGNSKEAMAEVQYTNGFESTPMGKLRSANGHEKPWKVKFWSIGNEMYGSWQLGHTSTQQYVRRHNGLCRQDEICRSIH